MEQISKNSPQELWGLHMWEQWSRKHIRKKPQQFMLSLALLTRTPKLLTHRYGHNGKETLQPWDRNVEFLHKAQMPHLHKCQCQFNGKLQPSPQSWVILWQTQELKYNSPLQSLRPFLCAFRNHFLTIHMSLTGIAFVSGKIVSDSGV